MSSAHNLPLAIDKALRNDFFRVDDPGAAGTFFIDAKGVGIARVVTAAAESRVLPTPAGFGVGQELVVIFDTDGGDLTITGAASSVVLRDAGDVAVFKVGRTKAGSVVTQNWRLVQSSALLNDAQLLAASRNMEQMTIETAVDDTATVTAAQLLKRIIDAVPTAAATFTLPTAALLVAAIPGAVVGDSFTFIITNNSAGAFTITVAAGAGGTADGPLTIAPNFARLFVITLTNVTSAAEAYTVIGLGDSA